MEKVAELRRASQAKRDEESARVAAARDEWDRQLLAAWPAERARLEREVQESRAAFRAAVLADPVWSAYRAQILAEHRLRTLWLDTSGVSARIDRGAFPGSAPAITELEFGDVARMVAQDAENQGGDEARAREAARENAGQAPA